MIALIAVLVTTFAHAQPPLETTASAASQLENTNWYNSCRDQAFPIMEKLAQARGQRVEKPQKLLVEKTSNAWYWPVAHVTYAMATWTGKTMSHYSDTFEVNKLTGSCREVATTSNVAGHFVEECKSYASEMLRANLRAATGASLDPSSVKVVDVDKRLGRTEYAWFQGSGRDANGNIKSITVMTQRSHDGKATCAQVKDPKDEVASNNRPDRETYMPARGHANQ